MNEIKKYLERKSEKTGFSFSEIRAQYPNWFEEIDGEKRVNESLSSVEASQGDLTIKFFIRELSDPTKKHFEYLEDLETYRELENVIITIKGQKEVSLLDLLPKANNIPIIINPSKRFNANVSLKKVDEEWRYGIILDGSLFAPYQIGALFHEIGHIDEFHKQKGQLEASVHRILTKLQQKNKLSANEVAFILQRERNAWSFTLKYLRRVFLELREDYKIEDLKRIIHQGALYSYSFKIKGHSVEE